MYRDRVSDDRQVLLLECWLNDYDEILNEQRIKEGRAFWLVWTEKKAWYTRMRANVAVREGFAVVS